MVSKVGSWQQSCYGFDIHLIFVLIIDLPAMSKPPQDNDEDDDDTLFHQYMKGTRPLQSDRRAPENSRHSARPLKQQQAGKSRELDLHFDTHIDINNNLFYHRGGLQHAYLKRLKRGDIAIDARLDLHGQRLEQAQRSLRQFIADCQESQRRCVLIIHGRGLRSDNQQPLLKQAVAQWLPQIDAVLAFSSAIPAHGGVGAVYVILRRR